MDETTLARAIQPFFSTKGIGKGMGLGLSMVHGLMGQLGRSMLIKSKPAHGTASNLYLPISPDAGQLAAATVEATPSLRTRGRVLLVDDEDIVRARTPICS